MTVTCHWSTQRKVHRCKWGDDFTMQTCRSNSSVSKKQHHDPKAPSSNAQRRQTQQHAATGTRCVLLLLGVACWSSRATALDTAAATSMQSLAVEAAVDAMGAAAQQLQQASIPARFCPDGGMLEAGLCYRRCKHGWTGLACLCWKGGRSYPRGCGVQGLVCQAASYRRPAVNQQQQQRQRPQPGNAARAPSESSSDGAGARPFSMVLSADPQLFRVVTNYQDLPNALSFNQKLVASINRAQQLGEWPWQAGGGRVQQPESLVVLGDMTEFYTAAQADGFRHFYDPAFPRDDNASVVQLPAWLMLGNHDAVNNVNACARQYRGSMDRNVCARTAVDTMRSVLTPGCDGVTWGNFPRANVSSFDAGSMAYSFSRGNWHFIVLQYSPRYSEPALDITPSLAWLAAELSSATARQHRIVLLLHAHRELGLATDPTFARLISSSNVVAIFYGHIHIRPWGLTGNYPNTRIPMFNCGASWFHVYCFAEFGRERFRVATVTHNSSLASADVKPLWFGASVHGLQRQQRSAPVLLQLSLNPPAAEASAGRSRSSRGARVALVAALAVLQLVLL